MNSIESKPRHIVITGASSGLGWGIAKAFDHPTNRITVVARRTSLLEKLASELKTETLVLSADLSHSETCCDFLSKAEEKFGEIDVIINNAGIQHIGNTAEVDVEEGEKVLRVNLHTPLRIINHLLPKMVKRNSGVIINVCSVAAYNFMIRNYYYNASKAGLANASESLSAELKSTNVQVITVYPGPVTSPMESVARSHYDSILTSVVPTGTPEGLAKKIIYAMEAKKTRVIYPGFYKLTHLIPVAVNWASKNILPSARPYSS